MKKTLLLLSMTSILFAELSDTVHSSLSTYVEHKTFSNSKQKTDAKIYGVGADVHYNQHAYKFTYEHGDTKTKRTALAKDLATDKIFLKYGYEFDDRFSMNLNFISILRDNIAPTDEGDIYAFGLSYNPSKKIQSNFTQYLSNYRDFKVYQSDLRVDVKTKISDVDIKISSITKYIKIEDKVANSFTKNAKEDYLTTGIKLHSHLGTYHFGAGAYLGKRVFAIMDDGFKVQHHAMEFDRTYALGFGKVMKPFVFRVQYIYQRATELAINPAPNKDIDVQTYRLVANYKF